jgi:hypothetical protein
MPEVFLAVGSGTDCVLIVAHHNVRASARGQDCEIATKVRMHKDFLASNH